MTACTHALVDFFSARARDVTPNDLRSSMHVLYVPMCNETDLINQCRSVLSAAELQRAQKLAFENARDQFIVRRAFRRFCGASALKFDEPLSRIEFHETKGGQPYLADRPDLSFSFSACSVGYLAAWSDHYNLGVDLEDPSRSIETIALAKRYFSKAEADAVAQAANEKRKTVFFQLWTLKEAALKSIGQGLGFGLDVFSFAVDPDVRILGAPSEFGGAQAFFGALVANTDGCAALVYHDRAQEGWSKAWQVVRD